MPRPELDPRTMAPRSVGEITGDLAVVVRVLGVNAMGYERLLAALLARTRAAGPIVGVPIFQFAVHAGRGDAEPCHVDFKDTSADAVVAFLQPVLDVVGHVTVDYMAQAKALLEELARAMTVEPGPTTYSEDQEAD